MKKVTLRHTEKTNDVQDKSLVDHVRNAEKVMYELRYVVKFMKSAAEAKRLQEEKQLAKEYERQEESKRIQQLKQQQKTQQEQEAATKIISICRRHKACRIYKDKKFQIQMESVLRANLRIQNMWIPFQRMFRKFSVRKWFADRSVVLSLQGKRKRKKGKILKLSDQISSVELSARVAHDVQQRRIVDRSSKMQKVLRLYAQLMQVLP